MATLNTRTPGGIHPTEFERPNTSLKKQTKIANVQVFEKVEKQCLTFSTWRFHCSFKAVVTHCKSFMQNKNFFSIIWDKDLLMQKWTAKCLSWNWIHYCFRLMTFNRASVLISFWFLFDFLLDGREVFINFKKREKENTAI